MGSIGPQEIVLILLTCLIYGALIVGVIWVVRALIRREIRASSGGAGETRETAAEILRKRYARGEITREQYQEMKRELAE
jgi:putative membrane protein